MTDKNHRLMRVVVPRENAPRETRVALVPEAVGRLVKSGLEVQVEAGAGERASFGDEAYRSAGATVVSGPREAWGAAEVALCVRTPVADPSLGAHRLDLLPEGSTLIGFLRPLQNPDLMERLAARRITAFAME